MKARTRWRAAWVMTGPMSVPLALPGPTLIFSASNFRAAISGSAAEPTTTATGTAMQRSPAEPRAPAEICEAAKVMLASGRTTAWLFAPPTSKIPVSERRSLSYAAWMGLKRTV